MTRSRREVYKRKWYARECKYDRKRRKKEIHRKVRHFPITEDSCSRGFVKNLQKLEWDTLS